TGRAAPALDGRGDVPSGGHPGRGRAARERGPPVRARGRARGAPGCAGLRRPPNGIADGPGPSRRRPPRSAQVTAGPPRKVMVVFGTRPDAVKMAPVVRALRAHPAEFIPIVVVTAQHREMLDQVLSLFAIVPDHDLGIMTEQQSLADITVRTLDGLSALLPKIAPDLVLVQGDAAPSFVGSLAAFYRRIPVGHVEAGLRAAVQAQPSPAALCQPVAPRPAD